MSAARLLRCLLGTCCVLASAGEGRGVEVTLNIDAAQSSLMGELFVVPVDVFALSQDAPSNSSLTTTYSGTITVDVDDIVNPTSIKILSARATAANSGDWLPDANGGSEGDPEVDGDADPGMAEPANYGWFLDLGAVGTVYAASRGTVLNVKSTRRDVANGNFDPLGIFITSPEGTFDGNVSSVVFGDGASVDIVDEEKGINCTDVTGFPDNCPGQHANYSVAGNTATLTLPFNFQLGAAHGIADFNFDEQIDAADYTEWRFFLGTPDPFVDIDGSGIVDQGDYELWKLEYGEEVDDDDDFIATFTGQFVATVELPAVGIGAAKVPEPASSVLLVWSALATLLVRPVVVRNSFRQVKSAGTPFVN